MAAIRSSYGKDLGPTFGQAAPATTPLPPPQVPSMRDLYDAWHTMWKQFEAISARIIWPAHLRWEVLQAHRLLSYLALCLLRTVQREEAEIRRVTAPPEPKPPPWRFTIVDPNTELDGEVWP